MNLKPRNLILVAALAGLMAGCSTVPEMTKATAASPQALSSYQQAANSARVQFNLPHWEQTPEQVLASADEATRVGTSLLNQIAAVPADQANLDNTLAALDRAQVLVLDTAQRIDVIREAYPDKAMRDAGQEATKQLLAWFTAASFRMDVYQSIRNFADTKPALKGEDALLLHDTLRDYRRNGMDLPQDKRDQLLALKNRLNELELEFARNISDAKPIVEYSADELVGASADFLANEEIKGVDGKYRVNANVTWQVIEVADNVKSEESRRKLSIARNQRAMAENTPIFAEILQIRADIAKMLGYANWADYRTEVKMAKTGDTALKFETDLKTGLAPKFEKEMETLRQLKVAETGDANAQIKYWDLTYYQEQLKKTRYQVDTNALKVYFELEQTLGGMFSIYDELFDLNIQEVQAPYKWADDLRLYAVSDSKTGAPLGLIYMDMFPRDGKYNHFAQFGITTGRLLPKGEYQRPVVALICNFPPATKDKPSLLSHDHVETLFHEFGHALHSVLTQAKYATYSGTSVPGDFVEAPSQMLENWVWDKKVLDRFAKDYRDPSKTIPAETLDKMEQARLATMGMHYRRQLAFGLLDMKIHTTQDPAVFKDFTNITNAVMGEVYWPVPENTGLVASFGHLAGGYDAGYYGYAWADAISADLASAFKQSPGGLMDHSIGRKLRDEIYAPGGSREAEDSIRAFLGRERSMQPFYKQIGL